MGLNSPNSNCRYTEYGNKFPLTPRSSKALSIIVIPIVQETVSRVFDFTGIEWERMLEIIVAKNTFLGCLLSSYSCIDSSRTLHKQAFVGLHPSAVH